MTIQEKAAKKLRQHNNHTPSSDTRKVLDEVIELIDEKIKKYEQEFDDNIINHATKVDMQMSLQELKEELEK